MVWRRKKKEEEEEEERGDIRREDEFLVRQINCNCVL
jgi:hypothetical protein